MSGLGCETLEALRSLIGDCYRCELGCTRTRLVFGVGDPDARVLIVGEAPGRNEDRKGEPFVGAAGRLLDELLAHAGLERGEVYIANVLKCRPPSNRNPEVREIETCTPFLREQIRLIAPEVIVTLGNFATRFVLETDAGISGLHGKTRRAGTYTVFPIFHPAAAIYDRTKREPLFDAFATLGELLRGERVAEVDPDPAPAPDVTSLADVIDDPGPAACDNDSPGALF